MGDPVRFDLAARIIMAAILLLPAPAGAQDSLGSEDAGPAHGWEGQWVGVALSGETPLGLGLELNRADGGLGGVFVLPGEGVRVPLSEVRLSGDSLVIQLAPGRTLRAVADGDSATGELEVNARAMPMTLGREGSPVADRLAARLDSAAAAARPAPLQAVAGGVAADGGAAAGVDAAALDRLVEASSDAHSHALVVIRGDSLVGTWYAGGERRMVETMSVTKSVLNLALGRLVTLGALPSIDVPVADYFPEWRETEREAITVRHLLNHTSGLADPGTGAIYASGDFVRLALESDLATTPGTAVAYNNNAVNLLAGLMCRAAGDRLDHFLAEDLFTRLGINQFRWSLDEAGNPHGMAGLQMYAEDLARLGQLVLRRGEWNGRQLIQSSWFDESLRPGSHLSDELGLLWWIIRDEDGQVVGYRADGYLGQYLVIYPEEELVAVRLVASSPAYDPDTDAFRDFPAMVMDLVR